MSSVSTDGKTKATDTTVRSFGFWEAMTPVVNEMSTLLGRMAFPFVTLLIVGSVTWFIFLVVPELYNKPLGLAVATLFSASFVAFLAYVAYRSHKLRRKGQ